MGAIIACGLWLVAIVAFERAKASEPTDPAAFQKASAVLDEKMANLRTKYHQIQWPADTPQAIGQLLKGRAESCTAFIRHALRYEPYRGILRSPQGTLDAGGGNSADLAFLLSEILRAGDPAVEIRFALGELTPQKAAELVRSAASAPPARPALAAAANSAPSAVDDPTGPSSPQNADETMWKVLADAQADLKQLKNVASGALPGEAAAISDARQHVWVQIRREGKWISFDPAAGLPLPDDSAKFVNELPPEWVHHVRLTVGIERLESARLVREPLLEQDWPASSLHGQPIDLIVLPTELSLDRLFDAQDRTAALTEQASHFSGFRIILTLASGKPAAGKTFNLAGTAGAAPIAAPIAAGTVDPFHRMGRGNPQPAKTDLAGVWLTLTVRSPGGVEHKVERLLLDRIGPSARAPGGHPALKADWKDPQRVRLALVQRHQILIATGPVSSARLAHQALGNLVENNVLQLAVTARQFQGSPSHFIAALTLPSGESDLVSIFNDALALTGANLAGEGIAYVARPNVYLRSEGLDLRDGREVVFRSSIDIASNRVRLLGEPRACEQARRLHGLWASELECQLSPARDAQRRAHAAEILRTAVANGATLRTVRNVSDLAGLDFVADVKAIMAQELAEGGMLLAPPEPVEVTGVLQTAWWHVDSEGMVLAIGPDGRGQAASEGEMVLTDTSIPMVRNCMKFVACFNKAVAGGQGMNDARGQCMADQIIDQVKESLDGSLKTFISAAQKKPGKEDPKEYNELYGKVEKAYEAYAKAMKMWDGTPIEAPGLNEGQDAANAGKAVGQALGFRVYLLLNMGHEIAGYASGL